MVQEFLDCGTGLDNILTALFQIILKLDNVQELHQFNCLTSKVHTDLASLFFPRPYVLFQTLIKYLGKVKCC